MSKPGIYTVTELSPIEAEAIAGSDRPGVFVPAILVKRLKGDAGSAIVLKQFIWWATTNAGDDGWFYQTMPKLQKSSGLGRSAQNRAIKRLIDMGILEKEVRGPPLRRWFRINFRAYLDLVQKVPAFNLPSDTFTSVPIPDELASEPMDTLTSEPIHTFTSEPQLHEELQESTTPRAESEPADPGNFPATVESSDAQYERIFGEPPKRPARQPHTEAEILESNKRASAKAHANAAGTPWASWGLESKKVAPRPNVPVLEIRMYGWYLEVELGIKPDWQDAKEVVAWTSGLAKLHRMSGGDVTAVVVVGKQMRADGLSVTRPRSLVEKVREYMGTADARASASAPAPGGHREWRT